MIVGHLPTSSASFQLKADTKVLSTYAVNRPMKVAKLTVYLKGGEQTQTIRGLIYDEDGNLDGVTEDVEIPAAAEEGWYDLPVAEPLELAEGEHDFGVQGGAQGEAVQLVLDSEAVAFKEGADAFADGAETTIGTVEEEENALAIYASVFDPFAAPEVEDLHLGRLPWWEAQATFAGAVPLEEAATCGWHGTVLSSETGAFALVNLGGPLTGLIGDRVRVRKVDNPSGVFVYVLGEAELEDDLSLTRRAFLALAPLADDYLTVSVGATI